MFDREKCLSYAKKWWNSFNPDFYNFENLGGDCTNFISQCLYAGGIKMNYLPNGWYYVNLNRRAPAWTGVNEFWDFAVKNDGVGLKIRECDAVDVQISDVVQLWNGVKFYHTVIITSVTGEGVGGINVAAHDTAVFNRPLLSYGAVGFRFGKIFD